MASFEHLPVFGAARVVVKTTYDVTATFPARERFGLASQMRRAAVSVLANIAEGWSRRSRRATASHLDIAYGSLRELEALAIAARDLEIADELKTARLRGDISGCSRQLLALTRALHTSR